MNAGIDIIVARYTVDEPVEGHRFRDLGTNTSPIFDPRILIVTSWRQSSEAWNSRNQIACRVEVTNTGDPKRRIDPVE